MIETTTLCPEQESSAQNLANNNATSGSSRQYQRAIEEELAAAQEIEQIQAFVNAQQTQQQSAVFDPISGEVIQANSSYEDELSIASILSLVERGASDDEIAAALDSTLETIAGKIVADRKNAKKHLAMLLETLQVLEKALQQQGRNLKLVDSLKQLQLNLSVHMQRSSEQTIANFLRNPALRQSLLDAVLQAREATMQASLRQNLATTRQFATELASRNLATKDLQLRDTQTTQLKQPPQDQSLRALRDQQARLSAETTTRPKMPDVSQLSPAQYFAQTAARLALQASATTVAIAATASLAATTASVNNNNTALQANQSSQIGEQPRTEPARQEAAQKSQQSAETAKPSTEKPAEPKAETKTEIKPEARLEVNPKEKLEVKIDSLQTTEPKPFNPCNGCGGGKGCCSSKTLIDTSKPIELNPAIHQQRATQDTTITTQEHQKIAELSSKLPKFEQNPSAKAQPPIVPPLPPIDFSAIAITPPSPSINQQTSR